MVKKLQEMFTVIIRDYHKDLAQHIRDMVPTSDIIPFETVLKRFMQAMIDLSINQQSVHYLNSTKMEFEKLYTDFEEILLKEAQGFVKHALEIGFKTKNLKRVYKIFGEYSTTVKSILPKKSQKDFEKEKTNIIIKFIRFILTTRMSAFAKADFSKIEKKWCPGLEHEMKSQFEAPNSVFMNHFNKVVDEKFDRVKFQKYWFMSLGTDTSLLIKFYDDSLLYLDNLLKAWSKMDGRINTCKQKIGVLMPKNSEEMASLSLTNSNTNIINDLIEKESESKCSSEPC